MIDAAEAATIRGAFAASRPAVLIIDDYCEGECDCNSEHQHLTSSRWARCNQECRGLIVADGIDHSWCGRAGAPPCFEGRQVWELRTECDWCREGCDVYECCVTRGGGGVVSWDYLCDRHRDHQGFHDCRGCCAGCDNGSVLMARVTVQVVPVVEGGTDKPAPRGAVMIYPKTGAVFLYGLDGDYARFALDPLPVSGRDFGVVLREAR